jgi:hypothetical protein
VRGGCAPGDAGASTRFTRCRRSRRRSPGFPAPSSSPSCSCARTRRPHERACSTIHDRSAACRWDGHDRERPQAMLQVTLDPPLRWTGTARRLPAFSCFFYSYCLSCSRRGTRASSTAGAGRSSTRSTRRAPTAPSPGRPRAAVEAFPLERAEERRRCRAPTPCLRSRSGCPPRGNARRSEASVLPGLNRSLQQWVREINLPLQRRMVGLSPQRPGGMTRLSARRLARRAGRRGDSRVPAVQAPGGPV